MATNDEFLLPGKIINQRWKVEKKLGKGSCGAVYKVTDLDRKPYGKAALKTEKHGDDKSIMVLKKEVNVLEILKHRKHVPRLLYSGRRNQYDYFVMTLLGKNLFELKKECNLGVFSAGTVSRVGIHVLYGLKQIHEIGYLHRDIKPANMVVGRGKQSRVVYVIDYGMARRFAVWENGHVRHRKARDKVLLRGTHRYCSPFVHERIEQGRRDDIFSLLYSLVFLHTGNLPWVGVQDEEEILNLKINSEETSLLEGCPPEWPPILKHVRELPYEQRPDYKFLYDQLYATMTRLKVKFADPYDWELGEKTNRTQSISQGGSLEGKINSREECKKPLEPVKPFIKPKTSSTDKKDCNPNRCSSALRKKKNTNDKNEKLSVDVTEKTEESAPRSDKADTMTAITDPANFISNDIGL